MISNDEQLTKVKNMRKIFSFNLTPTVNGGESIIYSCNYQDEHPVTEITLNSYSSISVITTYETITSDTLFKLAKELQKFEWEQGLTE
jgi:hypothetical protein